LTEITEQLLKFAIQRHCVTDTRHLQALADDTSSVHHYSPMNSRRDASLCTKAMQ